jgi:hypothetical protein
MMLMFEVPGGRAELVENPGPGETIKAAGTLMAVRAAANLICGWDGWRWAGIVNYAQREEDKRVSQWLEKAASEQSS